MAVMFLPRLQCRPIGLLAASASCGLATFGQTAITNRANSHSYRLRGPSERPVRWCEVRRHAGDTRVLPTATKARRRAIQMKPGDVHLMLLAVLFAVGLPACGSLASDCLVSARMDWCGMRVTVNDLPSTKSALIQSSSDPTGTNWTSEATVQGTRAWTDPATALPGLWVSNIVAWGDSLTAGPVLAKDPGPSWVSQLSVNLLTNANYYNGGISSQTSGQIMYRMLDPTNAWALDWTTIIWAGVNDASSPETIKSNITCMVEALRAHGNNRFLVLGVVTGGTGGVGTAWHANIALNLNPWIMATYPDNSLDMRSILMAHYDPSLPDDVKAVTLTNTVPPSLRVDNVHLNRRGSAIVASNVWTFITTKMAATPIPPAGKFYRSKLLQ